MHRITNLLILIAAVSFNVKLASAEFESVSLTGRLAGSTLEYRLNPEDELTGGRDSITIRYTVPRRCWLAVGVSLTGSMINSEAVIAKPEERSIRKYKLSDRSTSAITELPQSRTLYNATFSQSGGITILTYTKLLVEDGELTINGNGSNIFIAAFGSSNTFEFHQGYGSTVITLSLPIPSDAPTLAPTEAPVPAPTDATPIDAPATAVPAPTDAPVAAPTDGQAPTYAPVVTAPNPTPVSLDFEEVPLAGLLSEATFRYHLNRNDVMADGADTITIEFTCPGNVWAGVGVSQFGAMVPSKSVRGFPDESTPVQQYFMEGRYVESVNALPDDEQTLIDPQISFANDRTTLLYTLPLINAAQDEVFDIRADGTTNTNFIGACGTTAGQSFHRLYGSFGVTVKDPTPPPEVEFRKVALTGVLAEATFQYRLNRNDVMADGADTITIEYSCPGNVWVGVGVSQFGVMIPAKAVTGFPELSSPPIEVFLEARGVEGVTALPEQTLIDPQISFANDRTTMRYTIPIFPTGATTTANVENEALYVHADGRSNNFIGACGTSAGPSFHRLYGSFGVIVEEGRTEAPTAAAPFAAPTNPPGADILELRGALEGSTLGYLFTFDDPNTGGKDSITVTYTAPVTAWVGVGASETGLMIGSDAVIGIPATGEVKKYSLSSKSGDLSGVTPMPDDQQTLVNAAITQANGFTTLTYTKILVEDGEVPINRVGENIFIAAHGSSNILGFHSVRGSFSLSGKVVASRDNSLWVVHGWLAAIAWGVMCPLAILAGLFREYIPGVGTWFQIHRILQTMVIVLTIASVSVAIAALNKETPASFSASHFSSDFSDGHRLIGLLVLIFGIVQAANGIMRPHLPPKPEPDDDEEGNHFFLLLLLYIKMGPPRHAQGFRRGAGVYIQPSITIAALKAAVHEAGVAHGDLEMRNLVLFDGQKIKFIDFGNARLES